MVLRSKSIFHPISLLYFYTSREWLRIWYSALFVPSIKDSLVHCQMYFKYQPAFSDNMTNTEARLSLPWCTGEVSVVCRWARPHTHSINKNTAQWISKCLTQRFLQLSRRPRSARLTHRYTLDSLSPCHTALSLSPQSFGWTSLPYSGNIFDIFKIE